MPNMLVAWNQKVTKLEILKKLLKFKKTGHNHVTYLWWEPFIQPVFFDALKLGKTLGYTILVTTNCTTLHIDKQAKKYLPFIDQLIISIEAIDKDLQQMISQSKTYVKWEKVFENIGKYWTWNMLKANIVITNDNIQILFDIVKYLNSKNVKEVALTYPDLVIDFWYDRMKKIAPSYQNAFKHIPDIYIYCKKNNIRLKIPDFPFCVLPKEKLEEYIKLTDDYDYQARIKVLYNEEVNDRSNITEIDELPRERYYIDKCKDCKYKWVCWWPSIHYKKLYWLDEINCINK